MTDTVLSSLNSALHQALSANDKVYLLGEDILDPYGGAFKVTRGCSTAFPNRVIASPISEAGMVGIATGMALRGLRPVVEIMFGDFVTLAADQIINHLSKFRWMYNDQVCVPVIIRTPMGGRRGYGPTHSQTLEKFFLGTPGLRIMAPTSFGDPGGLIFDAIINTEDPVLFIENKLLYPLPLKNMLGDPDFDIISTMDEAPSYYVSIHGAPSASITLATYGYMAELAQKAMYRLAYEYEVFAELIVLTQLAPFNLSSVLESASHTGRLIVMEEGNLTMGWGAEVIARIAEASGSKSIQARRLAAKDYSVPASSLLETALFPGEQDIIRAGLQLTGKQKE
ncbi:MAG: hypothetical protein JW908_15220 [Anaerolineales bacterium]|nr:hypothetical protein [Anaerolineales bacterium]